MAGSFDSLLKISNSIVLQQFLHDCVDDLTNNSSKTKQANFDSYSSDIEWTIEDFNGAKTAFQKICREFVANENCDVNLNLPDHIEQEIKACIEIRKNEIFEALVKEKLVNSGHNLVENIDWRLKWILGNSKLASVREPAVQVDLHCVKNGPNFDKVNKNTVNFEVDLEKLDILIEQLNKASDELQKN